MNLQDLVFQLTQVLDKHGDMEVFVSGPFDQYDYEINGVEYCPPGEVAPEQMVAINGSVLDGV